MSSDSPGIVANGENADKSPTQGGSTSHNNLPSNSTSETEKETAYKFYIAGRDNKDSVSYQPSQKEGVSPSEQSDNTDKPESRHPVSAFTMFVNKSYIPTQHNATIPPSSPAKQGSMVATASELDQVLKTGDRRKIKSFLRANHWPSDHDVRQTLWLKLCRSLLKDSSSIYREMIRDMFSDGNLDIPLPSFVDKNNLRQYHLTETGVQSVKRIMCVLHNTNPDITFGPAIFPVASLFLHYLDEEDTYNCLYSLLRCNAGYLAQTKIAYEASRFVLKDLAKKYSKPFFNYITRRGLTVENVFEKWLWWIFNDLPFDYMVRIVDCYIYEGPKVLYRVALAILNFFYKIKVKTATNRLGADMSGNISEFCHQIPVPIDKLMKAAFGLRGLSRQMIQKIFLRNEMDVRSRFNVATSGIGRSASDNSLVKSPSNLAFAPPNACILNAEQGRARSKSHGTIPFTTNLSRLLTIADWQVLWQWLPNRISVLQPEMIYTTAEHGSSLKTFYDRCDGHEPVLLLIRTKNNEIIGAYCSTDFEERHHHKKNLSYFGTGETFLFTISPERRKYPWVGVTRGANIPNSAHQFIAADLSKFTVGGGNGEGLVLDDNLENGRSEHCDTYDNKPLVAGSDFECTCLEVFCFTDS